MTVVIAFIVGLFTGTFVAVAALVIVRNDDEPQVPFLLPGTWVVDIDDTGDCVAHERRLVDFDLSVRRLLDEAE